MGTKNDFLKLESAIMNELIDLIKKDLTDLYQFDKIENAIEMNKILGEKFIADNMLPMYFSGNYEAKTVFVMLNPGSKINNNYSFSKATKVNYSSIEDFLNKFIEKSINYGKLDFDRLDNFDLKQAAFLNSFEESGIEIPNFIEDLKNHDLKLKAKEAVLMNKLQVELIPYASATFEGLLNNEKTAIKNYKLFLPHIIRVLNTISDFDRKYVIFGAKQFYFLFKAYNHFNPEVVRFKVHKNFKIEGLKNSVNVSLIEISHKGQIIKAIIPHSFPRRDLPNAYEKMSKYGALCYNEYNKSFG